MHILGATLERQMLGRVAVGPTIVHVHVQIPAPPTQRRQIRDPIEHDPSQRRSPGPHRRVGTGDAEFGPVPHRDVHRARRQGQLGGAGRVEVAVLEGVLAAVERFIRVTPGIVGRIGPPVVPRDRDARG